MPLARRPYNPSRLQDLFLDLRDPRQRLHVREGLGTAQHFGRAEREQELLGAVEPSHAHGPRAHALQDVRVRAGALQKPVLAREAERFAMGMRIRAVEQGPDGAIWILEDEREGRAARQALGSRVTLEPAA